MSRRALMLQGTASSVGKSVLCAALCRIFARRGVRVAPFKAQNMSNNAFVTVEGGEIGRAQAVQAIAAGVEPTVDMNPILLKPEGERGSQVVVHGRLSGRLRADEFLIRKPLLWSSVERSLRSLLAQHELLIMEGAGSPAEINLKAGDIVNMRVAEAADAPVILVGDIDRGGVFASLVGTMELLEPSERERVRGFLINRFRGDPGLLQPGLDFLERRCGRPVLGVVPFLADLGLAEEDAATLEAGPAQAGAAGRADGAGGAVRVSALRLPRLANFDDLDPLRQAGAELSWVERPSQLGQPELIVLPGSKNTAADLAWLEQQGLSRAIVELADRGVPLLGICGGYQMLGERIEDPGNIESDRASAPGLGLLPVVTVLRGAKTTRQTSGRIVAGRGLFAGCEDLAVRGYEIHLGETRGPGQPLLELGSGAGLHADGRSARSGWIVGTYLHGLLESPSLVPALLGNLRARRPGEVGPAPVPDGLAAVDPYDRLADHVEAAVDLPRLFGLVGLAELV